MPCHKAKAKAWTLKTKAKAGRSEAKASKICPQGQSQSSRTTSLTGFTKIPEFQTHGRIGSILVFIFFNAVVSLCKLHNKIRLHLTSSNCLSKLELK
jgi:hypothetical protein